MNTQELKEKRLAFLLDTVAYYSANPSRRAVDHVRGECFYRGGKKRCAIGRHIPDESYSVYLEGHPADDADVLAVLPLPIRLLGGKFLLAVQSLHDKDENWQVSGLSETGESNLRQLKRKHRLE